MGSRGNAPCTVPYKQKPMKAFFPHRYPCYSLPPGGRGTTAGGGGSPRVSKATSFSNSSVRSSRSLLLQSIFLNSIYALKAVPGKGSCRRQPPEGVDPKAKLTIHFLLQKTALQKNRAVSLSYCSILFQQLRRGDPQHLRDLK